MLTVYLNQDILATQQNGADCLYSWTADVLSLWYTQSQSTQKSYPRVNLYAFMKPNRQ